MHVYVCARTFQKLDSFDSPSMSKYLSKIHIMLILMMEKAHMCVCA